MDGSQLLRAYSQGDSLYLSDKGRCL